MAATRFVFGLVMAWAMIAALLAARNRDFGNHRAWMIRAFALAVAGSTQAVMLILRLVSVGPITPQVSTPVIALGFVINLAFAEWRIRRFGTSGMRTTERKHT